MHIAKVAFLEHIFEMMGPPNTDPNHLRAKLCTFPSVANLLTKALAAVKKFASSRRLQQKHHLYDLTCER